MQTAPISKMVANALLSVVILAGCSWFRPSPQPDGTVVPQPIGGYTEIQKRLYYPEALREKGVEGQIVVKAYIDTSGNVTRTVVTDSLEPQLDQIAQRALAGTKFIPASQAGSPVAVWVSFPVLFSLADIPPLSSPYQSVRLEIEPQTESGRSVARLFLTLEAKPETPHHLELALPFTVEDVTIQEFIGDTWQPMKFERQLRDLDEWIIADAGGRRIMVSMQTRDVPGVYTDAIQFSLRLNHQLPAWICLVHVPGDRILIESEAYAVRLKEQRPGYTAYEINFPPLAPFETQHMELKLEPRE